MSFGESGPVGSANFEQDSMNVPGQSRVKVEDALSYLDQVKNQFMDDPQVYASFLDIMKDFKSQAIDTPGVIRRVSNLFAGKPNLIVGFNTFLPPGFKVHINGDRITISEPSGAITLVGDSRSQEQRQSMMAGLGRSAGAHLVAALSADTPQSPIQQQSHPEQMPQSHEDSLQQQHQPQNIVPTAFNTQPELDQDQRIMQQAPPERAVVSPQSQHRSLRSPSEVSIRTQQVALQMASDSLPLQAQNELNLNEHLVEQAQVVNKEPQVQHPSIQAMNIVVRSQLPMSVSTPPITLSHTSPVKEAEIREESEAQPVPCPNPGFNQALGYVNKIKVRFAKMPYVYKQFLDILTNYQTQMLQAMNNTAPCERYILDAIGELFADEKDLLDEFRYFLPEATMLGAPRNIDDLVCGNGETATDDIDTEEEAVEMETEDEEDTGRPREENGHRADSGEESATETTSSVGSSDQQRDDVEAEPIEDDMGGRSPSVENGGVVLRSRSRSKRKYRDESEDQMIDYELKEEELMFLDKVRAALTPKRYKNFVRGLNLFTSDVIDKTELYGYLKQIVGGVLPESLNFIAQRIGLEMPEERHDGVEPRQTERDPRINRELANEIDFLSCRQLGASYRALPESYRNPACSGRTLLCKQVLNDVWVSFPSCSSEDSSNVSSKKSVYEEQVYRMEDERFELDIIIEVNKYAIDALEAVLATIKEREKKGMDAYKCGLGTASPTIMQRAIKRAYGEASFKIMEGLKANPAGMIPRVFDRLRQKDSEWSEVQREMNNVWRGQEDKFMWRAMDHQSNTAKANDAKWMRAKALIHHIERLFDERQRRSVLGEVEDEGPHLVLKFPADLSVVHDTNDLVLHYIRRQTNIQKDEKEKMKEVVKRWMNEWFGLEREPDSEDEESEGESRRRTRQMGPKPRAQKEPDVFNQIPLRGAMRYRLIYGANPLFVLFRLYGMVCERLYKLKARCREMVHDYLLQEENNKKRDEYFKLYGKDVLGQEMNASDPHNGLAVLKPPSVNPEKFYYTAIGEIKNLIEGNLEQAVFEENVRTMFPTELHFVVMIDKFVVQISKQLHQLVCEEDPFNTLDTYQFYRLRHSPFLYEFDENRSRIEAEYADVAERKLNCANCFKIVVRQGGDEDSTTVAIELVDTETEVEEVETTIRKRQSERRRRELTRRKVQRRYGISTVRAVGMTHLKRNTAPRKTLNLNEYPKRKQFFHEAFDTVKLQPYSATNTPNFRMILRRKLKSRKEKLDDLKRSDSIRRERARFILDSDTHASNNFSWFTQGVTKVTVFNPDFPFLVYNRYTENPPPEAAAQLKQNGKS